MRKLVLGILVLFCLSFVIAGVDYDYKEKIVETKYYPGDRVTVTLTTYVDYDDEDRYSTYDYRHGYTYRSTPEYRDRFYGDDLYYGNKEYNYYVDKNKRYNYYDNYRYDRGHRYNNYKHDKYRNYDYQYYNNNLDYYYEYIPHLKNYQRVECYHYPPADKLFYTECPN